MAGFATIPQIEANVAVPTTTRPFRPSPGSNVPEIRNPIEGAVRPLAQGADQLARILEVQGRHQQILDSDAAEENFKSQLTQSLISAKQSLPGNQWADAVQKSGATLSQKMLDDPANQHIAGYLKQRLPALLAVMHDEALQSGAVETAKNQHDQYELLQKNMAGQAGADFIYKPSDQPIFKEEGPDQYAAAFARNKEFATGGAYDTKLSPEQEKAYRQWVSDKGVPTDPNATTTDYDMRGFFKEMPQEAAAWQKGQHFPDTYKTPYDTTFSAESKYAKPGTPLQWQGDALIDTRTGQLVAGSNGGFQDGPAAQAIRKKQSGMVNAMWANNPDARNLLNQKFDQMVTQERGQAIARNPDSAGMTLKFIKANPGVFDPVQQTNLLAQANQARDARMREIDSQYASDRASVLDYQQQYIAQHRQPDLVRLNDDAQHQRITGEDYRKLTGRDYQMPSDPTTLTNYDTAIEHAPSIDALQTIKANARSAADHKLLSGADIPTLDDKVDKRIEYIKTTVGKADIEAKSMLQRIYYPVQGTGPQADHDRALERRYPGIFKQAYEQAEGIYKSMMVGKESDPAAPWAAYEKATKTFPRPGQIKEEPTPKPLALTVTDAEALKAIEVAKRKGLIPSGPAIGAR